MRSLFFILLLQLSFLSCARQEKSIEPTPGMNPAADISVKTNGAYYTILEFEKGTSRLTQKSKDELQEFFTTTQREGVKSKEIKILTWPDDNKAEKPETIYARKHATKIADKRAIAIINYMKNKINAETELLPVNMAYRTSVLNQFLESDDPKVKKVFEKTGVIKKEGEDLAALKENQEGKALIIRDYE